MSISNNLSPQALAEACAKSMWDEDNASRHLGMELKAVSPGEATLSMVITEAMTNGHGTCHGGYIFTLADSAFAFACNSYNQRTVAQHCSVTYIAPADGDGAGGVATRPWRHLRHRDYQSGGRADRGIPRPLANGQGHAFAGIRLMSAASSISGGDIHGKPFPARRRA